MTTQQISPVSQFSIVILGAMNPAIHHPIWYQLNKLLGDDEVKQALTAGGLVNSPDVSQFSCSDFRITCMRDRWDIFTTKSELRARMLTIAAAVFVKLPETPIGLFAFNNDFHLQTRSADVGTLLGKKLSQLHLNLPAGISKESITINMDTPYPTTFRIEPSPHSPNMVFVAVNTNHPVPSSEAGYFDLTPMLTEFFEKDFAMASSRASAIAQAIDGGEGA